jgi:hypothetical protein
MRTWHGDFGLACPASAKIPDGPDQDRAGSTLTNSFGMSFPAIGSLDQSAQFASMRRDCI